MKFASRKLFVTLLGFGLGGYLAYTGKLDTASAALIGALTSGYLTANVGRAAVAK